MDGSVALKASTRDESEVFNYSRDIYYSLCPEKKMLFRFRAKIVFFLFREYVLVSYEKLTSLSKEGKPNHNLATNGPGRRELGPIRVYIHNRHL